MSNDNNWLLLATLTGVLTLFAIFCLIPVAKNIGLVDKPGGRKKHIGDIPLIGGISIFLVLGSFAVFSGYFNNDWKWVLGIASILIVIGLIDDLRDIRPLYKLSAQILAAILLMLSTGDFIQTIAYLPNGTPINIAELGYLITLFAVVGLINAFNMMDGIDGLATMQAILSIVLTFTSMLILKATFSNDIFVILLLGSLLGFLVVNLNLLPTTKVFLGDAGSMALGFFISWILVSYTQTPNGEGLPPSLALWVVTIPVADTLALSVRRILLKRSPFRPDRKHLHHICLRFGLSPRQSLIMICTFSLISYLIGISIYLLFGEIVSIVLFFVMIGLYYIIIKKIWRISALFRRMRLKN
jgi:UDP-GlcNAc:undecaprenyl-phosphate GlcNAc-1-phosphate transferase